MQILSCELTRLRIPFRAAFTHAAASRSHGDAIIVGLTTANGVRGFGEIQARSYVSGETNDAIWSTAAPALAGELLGRTFATAREIQTFTAALVAERAAPALAGGFDIALMDAFELEHGDPWPELLGPAQPAKPGRCLTVGEDVNDSALRNQARLARIGGYTVVKLKVSGAKDAQRILSLREWLGDAIAVRLDANGTLDRATAERLLLDTKSAAIESLEEPLPKTSADLASELRRLYEATGVPLVADESICTLQDLERWIATGGYQIVNVRIGKNGGVSGTVAVLETCLRSGLRVVSGTMVGETSVMLRASRKLLHHCDAIDYVEGINQARQLLEAEAIVEVEGVADHHFEWVGERLPKYRTGHKTATQP